MKNRGITLIALIVTVIIMVILASVTINLITNGGIIEKARNASKDYTYEAEKEEFELAVVAGKDFLTGKVDKEKVEVTLGENWIVNLEEDKIIGISPNGNEFTINLNIIREKKKEEIDLIFGSEKAFDAVIKSECYKEWISKNPNYDFKDKIEICKNNFRESRDLDREMQKQESRDINTYDGIIECFEKSEIAECYICNSELLYVDEENNKVFLFMLDYEKELTEMAEFTIVKQNNEKYILDYEVGDEIGLLYISKEKMQAVLYLDFK